MIRFLSGLLPNFFVRAAFNKLTSPQIRKLRERETKVLQTATQEVYRFGSFDIQLYNWRGRSNDTILLVHGWEGQAGNFADLILKLRDQDLSIIAFDGPSHGKSTRGTTSLFEFSDLVRELIKEYDIKRVISHSFGGVATTYALYRDQQIKLNQYVLITTPDRFVQRINDIASQYSIHEKVIERLVQKLECDYSINVNEFNVSDFVRQVNVEKAMIIHDVDDKVIPIEQSISVHNNWPQSIFEQVQHTGHFRILRDDRVLEKVVAFIIRGEH